MSDDVNKLYGKETVAVPPPDINFGVDTDETLFANIVNQGISGQVDMSPIEGFTQLSQARDQTYMLIDTMAEDSTMAAVLETYAEDATEYNDQGRVVYVESDDSNVFSYVNYLLDTLRVDKSIYKWVYSLCKYGDVYLRLYRDSMVNKKDNTVDEYDGPQPLNEEVKGQTKLDEDVILKVYPKTDKFAHYMEMEPNPAEMFELTQYGKSIAYIKANINTVTAIDNLTTLSYLYKMNRNDVEVFAATEYVHATLDDNLSRTPEEVTLFDDKSKMDSDENGQTYSVRRGQPLLQKAFKIWRQLMLMENSILLNRITKSATVRVVNVEVGDMPKENVGPHLHGIKAMFEQKAALNTAVSMSEYTNPGPMENTIYVPTHQGIGTLATQQVGGDVDVKSLADLDYFKNKLYTAVRVPKQYLGDTEDAAGFNGGTSLSIVSSRYAKLVKRIQNTIIQALTDAVNILLLDKGLDSYINKFQLRITPPTTQEELDRRDNLSNKISIVADIMNLISGDVEDVAARLTILKSLLSDAISDESVLAELTAIIDELNETPEIETSDNDFIENSNDSGGGEFDVNINGPDISGPEETSDEVSDEMLPSIDDLGIDMADNTAEI